VEGSASMRVVHLDFSLGLSLVHLLVLTLDKNLVVNLDAHLIEESENMLVVVTNTSKDSKWDNS
jgi:hypothetical protein